jgi:hypothetical protein rflaF_04587
MITMAPQNGEEEAEKFYRNAKTQKEQLEKRIQGLDNIIRCLYEDRVSGKITPERYDAMANGYEQEQMEKRCKLQKLEESIERMDTRDKCIQQFIRDAKQYVKMPKLTPELLRVFIRRIEVYEKIEKYSQTAGNSIIIRYTYRLPEQDGVPALEVFAQPTAKTA